MAMMVSVHKSKSSKIKKIRRSKNSISKFAQEQKTHVLKHQSSPFG